MCAVVSRESWRESIEWRPRHSGSRAGRMPPDGLRFCMLAVHERRGVKRQETPEEARERGRLLQERLRGTRFGQ